MPHLLRTDNVNGHVMIVSHYCSFAVEVTEHAGAFLQIAFQFCSFVPVGWVLFLLFFPQFAHIVLMSV